MLFNVGEMIVSKYIATDCRTFRPRRPSSAACKTIVLYAILCAADEGLCGQNVLQPVVD